MTHVFLGVLRFLDSRYVGGGECVEEGDFFLSASWRSSGVGGFGFLSFG